MTVTEAQFRAAMGRLVSGVVVASCRQGGQDHATTLTSLTSVSLEPMLVLACLHAESRFGDAVLQVGQWAVSVLGAPARPVAHWLADPGRPVVGQLERVPHHRGPVTGAALLDGALATLELRTWAVHPGGDHRIVVGEVVGLELPDEVPAALTHYRGGFGALA